MKRLLENVRDAESARQLFRYALIGVAGNLSAYLAYLLITYLGGTPKITMSVLYVATAIVSFIGNRQLTFEHTGSLLGSGMRFVVAHLFGYLINLTMLFVLVDKFGYPHQWVQVSAVFIVAIFLFITFKYLVFSEKKTGI